MSEVSSQQVPQTPKKTPAKTPTKKTPKKVQRPEPEAEPEDSQQLPEQDDADDTQLTNGAEDAQSTVNDAQSQAEDAEDEGEQAAGGAGESAGDDDEPQSVAEGAESQAEDVGQSAEDETEDPQAEAQDAADGAGDDAQAKAQDTSEEAQGEATEAGDDAEATGEGAEATGEDHEATVDDAKDDAEGATGDAANAATEDGEGEGDDDVVAIGRVGQDGKSVMSDEGQLVGQVEGDELPEGSVVDQDGDVMDAEGNVIGSALPNADGAAEQAEDTADGVQDAAGDDAQGATQEVKYEGALAVDDDGQIKDDAEKVIATLPEDQQKELGDQEIKDIDTEGNLLAEDGNVLAKADLAEGVLGDVKEQKPQFEGPLNADKDGSLKDSTGKIIATLSKEELEKLGDQEISDINAKGEIIDKEGNVIAKAELAEGVLGDAEAGTEELPDKPEFQGALKAGKDGVIKDETGKVIANLSTEELKKLGKQTIADIDGSGVCYDKKGKPIAQATISEPEELDYSILSGLKLNKRGNVTSEDGVVVGKLVDGDLSKLVGKACDSEGRLWDDKGTQIGQCEPLPESERQAASTKPFEDFPNAVVERSGDVTFEGRVVGRLVEGDKKQCEGKAVDADGDVSDKNGSTIGRAERLEDEAEPEAAPELDYSILVGHKVNKSGQVVDENDGTPLGRVVEGELKLLVNKKVAKEGKVYNDSGEELGRCEPLPENERITPTDDPFADFQPSIVQKNGDVNYNDKKVGEVSEGDPAKMEGRHVDEEGDIVDSSGSVIGKAIRWHEPDAEEEAPIDMSILAGKKVNKQGYVADSSTGQLFGRVVEGDPKKMVGCMCDKEGVIWGEGGSKVGRAELLPESEREGSKSGPFSDFQPCTVAKDGTVVFGDRIVGRVTEGDASKLYGKAVDEDGDVNDNNGNKLGSCERWEPEEKEVEKHPAAGRKLNSEGKVIGENGDPIAQLTEGDLERCRGAEIDNDGDVVDKKGKSIGHVTLMEHIKPDEEPQGPSEEELAAQKEAQDKSDAEAAEKKKDSDLAKRMGFEIDGTLERVKPVLDEMTEYIEEAEAKQQRKEKVDQEQLSNNVKPLIHKGSDILNECNQNIRGMDPDGRIQSKAKQNAGSGEATPEENHLAEGLKSLTGGVQDTIEKCKKKLKQFPEAEEELSPLWGLLSEPLFQILAAVGLLLSGVLGLVGKLLGGLGLGGILDGVLGGLGVNKILDGLGVGGLLGGK